MIRFFSETEFDLQDQDYYRDWINACVDKEKGEIKAVNVIFCDDDYLLEINKNHLDHDYYTDIITFDYSEGDQLFGDIFISVERVADNAHDFNSIFDKELSRVMIHGFLHMLGYKDKTKEESALMRCKENECLGLQ